MKTLRSLTNCIMVEAYKLRNTLAQFVAFGIPLFIVLLSFVIFYSDGEKLVGVGTNPWIVYSLQSHNFWAGILLALNVILTAALVNAIEHRNDT